MHRKESPMISNMEKNKIFVTLNATFKDEKTCRTAMETIVNDAHAAYGVNSHFWFKSADGKSLFVLEQYEDKKAVTQAIRRFTTARINFFRSIKDIEIVIYGNVSTIIKLMFAALRPQYMNYYEGYSKNIKINNEPGIKPFERNRILVVTNAELKNEQSFKSQTQDLIKNSFDKVGIKSHFFCINTDKKQISIIEQYEDEAALFERVEINQHFAAGISNSVKITDVTVYGADSNKINEAFAEIDPEYMNYFGGYSK